MIYLIIGGLLAALAIVWFCGTEDEEETRPTRGANLTDATPLSVSISGSTAEGALATIALTKTGSDEVSAHISTWNVGNTSGSPDADNTLPLTGVKAASDGSELLAATTVSFFHPELQITMQALAGGQATATVTVSNAWPENSVTTYVISGNDFSAAEAFLKAASFPAI